MPDAAALPQVFISYSHKDETWLDMLRPYFAALTLDGLLESWDDRRIEIGADWTQDIQDRIKAARVGVLLVTQNFLASSFCSHQEVPAFLDAQEKRGLILVPILVAPCTWKHRPSLAQRQMIPRDGKPLKAMPEVEREEIFVQVAEFILERLKAQSEPSPGAAGGGRDPRSGRVGVAQPVPACRLDLDHLPQTGLDLFGREREWAEMDRAWDTGKTVFSLVAGGGVGKSTLARRWAEDIGKGARGAKRVFGWSFYSQGSNDQASSADPFLRAALRWFGGKLIDRESPWDQGERLAGLVRNQRTLLVLDGLEPLQWASGPLQGQIKDPGLATLVTELAQANPGLCLITTRVKLAELEEHAETTVEHRLDHIPPEAGARLLHKRHTDVPEADRRSLSRAVGHHALAVTLLNTWLRPADGDPLAAVATLPQLPEIPVTAGRHPRRVLAAFAARFGEGPEREALRLLGLFDRPADPRALEALRAPPGIPHLTEHLHALSDGDWRDLIDQLRDLDLIARRTRHAPRHLDAHPLVREHFGEELKTLYPDSWSAGHDRLYQLLIGPPTKDLPDTLEEMAALFLAVAHGCAAGRHQDAFDEVFWRRLQRNNEAYSIKKLGAFGATLAALAGFFDLPWSRPVATLTDPDRRFVLTAAAFTLHALGWLAETVELRAAALEMGIAQEDWRGAATSASNLSSLLLTLGRLAEAEKASRRAIDFGDRTDDDFGRLVNRITLADALHKRGEVAAATALFAEVELLQRQRQPAYPYLYSHAGFQYCDLLLDQGGEPQTHDQTDSQTEPPKPRTGKAGIGGDLFADVRKRANFALTIAERNRWLLDIALDHLTLGHAYDPTLAGGDGDPVPARTHLDEAVNGLRKAGHMDYLPLGLLARAAFRRGQKEWEGARHDLDEAVRIARRGGMRLYLIDGNLEAARLALARGDPDKARPHLARARTDIAVTGYHRRDRELEELEKQAG